MAFPPFLKTWLKALQLKYQRESIQHCIVTGKQGSLSTTFYACIIRTNFHMKNARVKCWWNWRQGLLSPTCLCTAITSADTKSVKIQSCCQYLFALLGSAHVKALRKMLMKLSTSFNFNNSLRSTFNVQKSFFPQLFRVCSLCLVIFCKKKFWKQLFVICRQNWLQVSTFYEQLI